MEILNLESSSVLMSMTTLLGLVFFAWNSATKTTRIITRIENLETEIKKMELKQVKNANKIIEIDKNFAVMTSELQSIKTILTRIESKVSR